MKYKVARILRNRVIRQNSADKANADLLHDILIRKGSVPMKELKALSGLGSSEYKRAFTVLNRSGRVWQVSKDYEPAGKTVS